MQKELNQVKKNYYVHSPVKDNNLKVGHYYTLYHEQNWHRIVIKHIDHNDDFVRCFFVDAGNSMVVKKNRIYPLESKFYDLNSQVDIYSLIYNLYFKTIIFLKKVACKITIITIII